LKNGFPSAAPVSSAASPAGVTRNERQGVAQRQRQAEMQGQAVARATRHQRQRGRRVQQGLRHLVHGSVAAHRDHLLATAQRGLARKLRRVAGGFR
jgi:hypothetical protein